MGGGNDEHHGGHHEDSFEQPVFGGPSKFLKSYTAAHKLLQRPVVWFRENIVVPNRKQYPWYHQKFPRVKTIEKCHIWEYDCIYEANEQFLRDMEVDSQIMRILRRRHEDCMFEEYPDHFPRCQQLMDDWQTAVANWFTKYGDLGYGANVQTAFMKQKHRLLWERRHGPIGTGMKVDQFHVEPEDVEH